VAEAASKKKVKHLIWSTIEYTPDFGAKDTIPTIEMDGAAYKGKARVRCCYVCDVN
jgi:hypothetical protein